MLLIVFSAAPDSPVQPSVGFQNVSLIEVKWEKPKNPRGRIDMYDVQFKKKVQYSNETVTMENITGIHILNVFVRFVLQKKSLF